MKTRYPLGLPLSAGCALVAVCILLAGCTPQRSYALQYDGVDDQADCGHAEILDITDRITIEAWVKHNTGNPKQWEDMVMKGNESHGFQFYEDEGSFTFHLASGVWRNLSSNVRPEAGVWYHVAGTYDGATQKVYVNGELANTAEWTGSIESHPADSLMIGGKVAWDNNWLNGEIDEIRVWNIVRTASEIRDNMDRHLGGSERGLVAYYRMDEGKGQTIKDLSGKGNHCRLGSDTGADGSDPKWIKTEWPYGRAVAYSGPFVVSAAPFRLIIPPDTLPAGTRITMRAVSDGGTPTVRISPSPFSYGLGKAAILLYNGPINLLGTLVWVGDDDRTYIMPTVTLPGVGVATFIGHHSEYRYVPKGYSHVDVGGVNVPLWQIAVEACQSGHCDLQTFIHFTNVYLTTISVYELGRDDAWGLTRRACEFQPAYVSIEPDSKPGTKQVVIRAHRPHLVDSMIIPAREDIQRLASCSDAEKNYVYDFILGHEKKHAQVDIDWENGAYGDTLVQGEVIFPDIEVGDATDAEIMEGAYMEWCRAKVFQMTAPYHAPIDQHAMAAFWSQVTCPCAVGSAEPDPNFPEINCISQGGPSPECTEMTYCPCDDPGSGKPRDYETEGECAAQCPSGMSCFAVQCTIPPDCGS